MPRFDTIAPNVYKRVLIFGPPKVGKSLLAAKLAEEFFLDWHDAEQGYEVIRQLPVEWQQRINLYRYPDTPDFPIAVDSWRKIVKNGTYKICNTHGKVDCSLPDCKEAYDTYDNTPGQFNRIRVFDSLTQFSNSSTNFITKRVIAAAPAGKKPLAEDVKFGYDEYGLQGKINEQFLSYVQQAQSHIICISHETEVELEDGKNKLVATLGTRNYSRNSAKAFDHVIYCSVNSGKHNFGSSTTYMNNVVAGSRTNVSLETMAIPSLLPIFRGEVPSVSDIQAAKTPGQIALANLRGVK